MEFSGSGNATDSPPEPILSGEAIANIIVTLLAVVTLASAMCIIAQRFQRQEHNDRVRMAKERNRQIDRQLAAAKARQERQVDEVFRGLNQQRQAAQITQTGEEVLPDVVEEPPLERSSLEKMSEESTVVHTARESLVMLVQPTSSTEQT